MNTKNDTFELEILVRDTFADGHIVGTVLLSDEELAHIENLSSEWDNPWELREDPLVGKIREYASEIGNDTGINEGEWELEEWEIKKSL